MTKSDQEWFKKAIMAGLVTFAVTLLTYALTSFATVDYVKDYVDIRHQNVLEKLDDIASKLDTIAHELTRRGEK